MIRSLFRTQTQLLFTIKQSNLTHLRFLHKPISNNPEPNPSDFTVSYLINSWGLSPQSALSAAKKIPLKTTENPDSILNFLKSHGFTDTQITNIITRCPKLLSLNFEKTIKPKLDYLQSIGYSGPDLADLVSSAPRVLTASLEKRLKPNFELLLSIIGSNQHITSALRQTSWLLQSKLETAFLPNVRTLQSWGIPEANIAKLAAGNPRVVMMPAEQFKKRILLIKEMGFNPLSTMFVYGVAAASRFNPSTWDKKVALYKSLGWSCREVISAFVKQPYFMLVSEKKIRKLMDFYVKRLQWGPSFLSSCPMILCLSLEKRVMPRFSVLSLLESKGLVMLNSSVTFLMMSEKDFLNKYVIKYKDRVPEVLEFYKVNLESVGPDGGSASVNGS